MGFPSDWQGRPRSFRPVWDVGGPLSPTLGTRVMAAKKKSGNAETPHSRRLRLASEARILRKKQEFATRVQLSRLVHAERRPGETLAAAQWRITQGQVPGLSELDVEQVRQRVKPKITPAQRARAEKLRRMTVANGCTRAEADVARVLLAALV